MLPPCLHNWTQYAYQQFAGRAVYSPIQHMIRNLSYGRGWKRIAEKDAEYYAQFNHFDRIELRGLPNVVLICVESYGSVAHRKAEFSAGISDLLIEYETRLSGSGLTFASNFSAPPIFAGGSWLSYVSFTYGFRLDDLQ